MSQNNDSAWFKLCLMLLQQAECMQFARKKRAIDCLTFVKIRHDERNFEVLCCMVTSASE
jgi:hypothetical protein